VTASQNECLLWRHRTQAEPHATIVTPDKILDTESQDEITLLKAISVADGLFMVLAASESQISVFFPVLKSSSTPKKSKLVKPKDI
jgi:hypothetical protein